MVANYIKVSQKLKNKGYLGIEKLLQNEKKSVTIISRNKKFFVFSSSCRNYFRLENLVFSDNHKKFFQESIRNFFSESEKLVFRSVSEIFLLVENRFFQASPKDVSFLKRYKKVFFGLKNLFG